MWALYNKDIYMYEEQHKVIVFEDKYNPVLFKNKLKNLADKIIDKTVATFRKIGNIKDVKFFLEYCVDVRNKYVSIVFKDIKIAFNIDNDNYLVVKYPAFDEYNSYRYLDINGYFISNIKTGGVITSCTYSDYNSTDKGLHITADILVDITKEGICKKYKSYLNPNRCRNLQSNLQFANYTIKSDIADKYSHIARKIALDLIKNKINEITNNLTEYIESFK